VTPDCAFCAQTAGLEEHNEMFALTGERWALRPVLAERGAAIAMPSIGALAPGHMLVCPVAHHRSLLAAPDTVAAAVQELLGAVRSHVEHATGTVTHVFEHGSSRYGERVACSVEHAHLHVLPCESDVLSAIADIADWKPAGRNLDELRRVVGDSEYLIYESPTGQRLTAITDTGLPSQLLRRVFASALDVSEWDWRVDPAVGRVAATAELYGVRIPARR
jgi:diadenosine tetraphosphate (Ap4A) HIT family hydrolase